MRDKPLVWLGSARRVLRAFPVDARRRAGFQLRRVQQGFDPRAHRVFYVATFAEAVYILHAFEKKTRKTASREIELARERYLVLLKERVGR